MSQKLDAQGNIVGPYKRDDLRTFWFPKKKLRDHRRKRLREFHYDLIWEITEMQVKVYVQGIFQNQVGSPLSQLAKEQALGPDEKTVTGESRSKALDKDIEISNGANEEHNDDDDEDASDVERRDALARSQQVNRHPRQHQQPEAETSSSNSGGHQQRSRTEVSRSRLTSEQEQGRPTHRTILSEVQEQIQGLPQHNAQPSIGAPSSSNSRTDGRRRDGCYTCKVRKKKCDCTYIFDETSGTQKCNTCLRVGYHCDITEPDWAHDPVQRELQQRERRRLVKLGKRKSRDESESSGSASRDRSMTIVPDSGRQPSIYRSIETPMEGLSSQLTTQPPVRRGAFTAIRGGKGGFKHPRY